MGNQKVVNVSLIIVFISILVLPTIGELLGIDLDSKLNFEKRRPIALARVSLDSLRYFPSHYEKYYNDNFLFRNILIKLNNAFSTKTYGLSAVPDVIVGNSGWLYYVAKSQGNSLEDYQGLIKMDRNVLELIRQNLERRTAFLKEKGMRFVVVIPPDKHSIYPEYLPKNVQRPRRYPTRLDQIVEYLKERSTVEILDTRATMLREKEKSKLPLYKKTDSHWNSYGAFITYQQIMKRLESEPLKATDLEWKQSEQYRGDLAIMLAMGDQVMEVNHVDAWSSLDQNISSSEIKKKYGPSLTAQCHMSVNKDQSLPKLLVFNDSFGAAMRQFLSYHFRESVFIQTDSFSNSIIEIEKPDVVIMEVVERYALSLAWGDSD